MPENPPPKIGINCSCFRKGPINYVRGWSDFEKFTKIFSCLFVCCPNFRYPLITPPPSHSKLPVPTIGRISKTNPKNLPQNQKSWEVILLTSLYRSVHSVTRHPATAQQPLRHDQQLARSNSKNSLHPFIGN